MGQDIIFLNLKVASMSRIDYKTSYITITLNHFKITSFLRWSYLKKTLNLKLWHQTPWSLLSKITKYSRKKIRKFIWNGAEFLFNSAYVIFLYFLINGKNSDPTYDSLYMCSCQHDERLKLQYLMKISDFLYSGYAAFAMHKHVAC